MDFKSIFLEFSRGLWRKKLFENDVFFCVQNEKIETVVKFANLFPFMKNSFIIRILIVNL